MGNMHWYLGGGSLPEQVSLVMKKDKLFKVGLVILVSIAVLLQE